MLYLFLLAVILIEVSSLVPQPKQAFKRINRLPTNASIAQHGRLAFKKKLF